MIEKKRTATGSLLSLTPFTDETCRIIAEITSHDGRRRDVKLRVTDLRTMTIADTAILMNNLRAMIDAVHKEMGLAQKRAAKKAPKARKKAAKKR